MVINLADLEELPQRGASLARYFEAERARRLQREADKLSAQKARSERIELELESHPHSVAPGGLVTLPQPGSGPQVADAPANEPQASSTPDRTDGVSMLEVVWTRSVPLRLCM